MVVFEDSCGNEEVVRGEKKNHIKSKLHVTGLVSCGESGPRLISPPVVVLGIRHLHIVAESDEDFGLSQLLHRRPLAQLRQKRSWRAENEVRSLDLHHSGSLI